MQHYPYIIIGQGLAGTMLSMRMNEAGINHLVLDEPRLSASSKIAAGLANPIVLKRLKWVKDAELFMPVLSPFYKGWEKTLNAKFFHEITLHHIFHDTEEVNHWMEKSDATYFKNHLGAITKNTHEKILAPHGVGALNNVAWINTSEFLNAYKGYLLKKGQYHQVRMDWPMEEQLDNLGISADRVIYCTGHLLRKHFTILEKCFTPTRGEVMVLGQTDINEAWHKAIFTLPLGNGLVKIGATYAHDILEDATSEEGKSWLLEKLKQFYRGEFTIVAHEAGVRPNISDRKPLMGRLSDNVFVFNGMGSRGVLMAPYLSQLMLDYLQEQETIPERWDVKRFTSN